MTSNVRLWPLAAAPISDFRGSFRGQSGHRRPVFNRVQPVVIAYIGGATPSRPTLIAGAHSQRPSPAMFNISESGIPN